MAVEYIKKGEGKLVAGEELKETTNATMLALTEVYEDTQKSKNEIMLALAEVYEMVVSKGGSK